MRTVLASAALLAWCATVHAEPCEAIPIWRDGHRDGVVCRGDVMERGLTVIELGDDWVPALLAAGADGTGPSYRATYVALAHERFADAGPDADVAAKDRYLELFGVEPTLAVVRDRLAAQARHGCHGAIDNTALAAAVGNIAEESKAEAAARLASATALRADLEHDRTRRKVADLEALAATGPYFRRHVDRLIAAETYLAAVRAAQAHLACDGLFAFRPIDAAYTWQTSNAIESFQRGVMILPTGVLDPATRDALALDSYERDFRTALRVLRARVVAATGLIEDGSAGEGEATVLGRPLDSDAVSKVRGHDPLDGAAADLISAATEAAARALGWYDAASTLAFLDMTPAPEIAVKLPAPPSYHAAGMTLSVDIDRGDVWYEPRPRPHDVTRRPVLILYVTDGDRRIPLVRWPTTIGGWQKQVVDGDIEKRWKESPVGPRLWRDLYVGPTWLPPRSTPDRELVRSSDDHDVLAREALGPSYRAAFGLAAFPHLVEERHHGKVELEYEDVRTHGTGNVASIRSGVSHGCHRLLGMQVVRLADFVLAHQDHVRHGDEPTHYRRIVRYRGRAFRVAIDSLGYRIELVSPIHVDVLPGRIHRR